LLKAHELNNIIKMSDIPTKKKHTKELIGKLLKEDPALSEFDTGAEQEPMKQNRESWISVATNPSEDEVSCTNNLV